MANKFNNNPANEARKEYTNLNRNDNILYWEFAEGPKGKEFSRIERRFDDNGNAIFHLNGRHYNPVTKQVDIEDRDLRPDEMTNEEFDTSRDAMKESSHELAKIVEGEERNFGTISLEDKVRDEDGNEVRVQDLINEVPDTEDNFSVHTDNVFFPMKNAQVALEIIDGANLTDTQRDRYFKSNYNNMTEKEIATEEGKNQKSVHESIASAKAKVEQSREKYLDVVHGVSSNFEANQRFATRSACSGCIHYNANNDTCMKYGTSIFDEIENHGSRVHKRGTMGFEYTQPSCYEIDFEAGFDGVAGPSLFDSLTKPSNLYHKPEQFPIYKAEHAEEMKAQRKHNKQVWDSIFNYVNVANGGKNQLEPKDDAFSPEFEDAYKKYEK